MLFAVLVHPWVLLTKKENSSSDLCFWFVLQTWRSVPGSEGIQIFPIFATSFPWLGIYVLFPPWPQTFSFRPPELKQPCSIQTLPRPHTHPAPFPSLLLSLHKWFTSTFSIPFFASSVEILFPYNQGPCVSGVWLLLSSSNHSQWNWTRTQSPHLSLPCSQWSLCPVS